MSDQGDNERRPTPLRHEADPDAPPTEEEIAASQRLRDALEDPRIESEDAELARSLRAAFSPAALSTSELEDIVESSLSATEREAAAALRDALDGKDVVSDEAQLVQALAAAWNPKPLADEELRAIVERAVGTAEPAKVLVFRKRSTVVRVAFGAAGVVALAASLVLVIRQTTAPGETEAPLARARSTQDLFTEPFKTGDASARIDKIAMARASDYRDNRFAKWGVR